MYLGSNLSKKRETGEDIQASFWEGKVGVRDAVVSDMAVDITENENEVVIFRDKFEGRALIRCRNLEIGRWS